MFVTGKLFPVISNVVVKVRSLHLSGATERCFTVGHALAVPTNMRLGSKGLPRTNALAYYKISNLWL